MPTWREIIPPDEAARFEKYATQLRDLHRARDAGRTPRRGLHLKPHLGAVGTLEIGALPPPLRQAIFATPRSYPLYVRFSNGLNARQHDGVPDIRGVALKLVGVPGKKLIPGLEDKLTQDFLLIQTPSITPSSPDDFVKLVLAASKGKALLLPRLVASLGLGTTLRVVKAMAGMPKVASMATGTFYTALPLRFGDTAAKLALFPTAADAPRGSGPDALRQDLVARLKAGPLVYSLRAQLFVDEATTPIEDSSVRWPEEKSPYLELGKVTLPAQDVAAPRGQEIEALVESFSFDPWHAVEELRPIGAYMRARAPAYRESVLERKAADEPEAVLEPAR